MNKKNTRLAFSLIELSVVILVIGILVIGITQGGRILSKSKLSSAMSLSNSSPVNSISNLRLWLDTSDINNIATGAFNSNIYGNAEDQDFVSNWLDRNPQSPVKIKPSAIADSNRPQYIIDGIGHLPSIKFDGSNDYLISTTSTPLGTGTDNFTYVAVWKMLTIPGAQVIFEQNNNSTAVHGQRAAMLAITGTYGFNGENNDAHVSSYSLEKGYISVITVQDSGVVKVYTNSKTNSSGGSINIATENVSGNAFCVAAKCISSKSEFFSGYISEIIVFDRTLKLTEISDIVDYLSKKYDIKVN